MPALEFPYDAIPGAINDPAESEAQRLYQNYAWIARNSRLMANEADLDKKKLMQVMGNAMAFRHFFGNLNTRRQNETIRADEAAPYFDPWPIIRPAGEIMDTIEGYFTMKASRWATRAALVQDLVDLHGDCLAFHTWVEANFPSWRVGFSINNVIDLDVWGRPVFTDTPARVTKPTQLGNRISALAARFPPLLT